MTGEYTLLARDQIGDCRLIAPDGSDDPVPSSFTALWQTWIARGQALGVNWRAIGCRAATGGAVVHQILESLEWPSVQGRCARIDGVTLGPPVGYAVGGPLLVFNSCMMFDFSALGSQLLYNSPDQSCVSFRPRSKHELDGGCGIIDSRFTFQTVGCDNHALAAIEFDPRQGLIAANTFTIAECNAGPLGQYGMLVRPPSAGHQFTQNVIRCPHVHGASIAGLLIDGGAAGPLHSNRWEIDVSTEHPTARGINSYGGPDVFLGSVHGPVDGQGIGVLFNAPANGNLVVMSMIEGGLTNYGGSGNRRLQGVAP